jgi:hypothetical protein
MFQVHTVMTRKFTASKKIRSSILTTEIALSSETSVNIYQNKYNYIPEGNIYILINLTQKFSRKPYILYRNSSHSEAKKHPEMQFRLKNFVMTCE